MVVQEESNTLAQLNLPPGFRFYPTDEELLVKYLCKKVAGHQFSLPVIADVDLYKFDPWVLPSKAIFGEKEWYFFSPRDRKYPNGSRPNRVAGSGYWKATGTDKIITTEIQGKKVGIKKALVFYVGKAPKGTKTNWIMHEYRLFVAPKKIGSKLDDWVLCRIYKKNTAAPKPIFDDPHPTKEQSHVSSSTSSSSQLDDVLESLPEMDEQCFSLPRMNNPEEGQKLNLQSMNSGSFDWGTFTGLNSLPELTPPHPQTQHHLNNNNGMIMPNHEEEVESEMTTQTQTQTQTQRVVDNSGLIFNSNAAFTQNFPNSIEQFVARYPNKPGSFGFKQ